MIINKLRFQTLSQVTDEMNLTYRCVMDLLKKHNCVPMSRSRAYAKARDYSTDHVFYWGPTNSYYVVDDLIFNLLKLHRTYYYKLNDMIQRGDV